MPLAFTTAPTLRAPSARDEPAARRYTARAMSEIQVYNTMTRKLEAFEPRTPGKVGVYLCGTTPYNVAHAGHARSHLAFDVLVRHLKARGYDVTFVRNLTDVDDKILAAAEAAGEEPLALSARMAKIIHAEMHAIGVLSPDVEPRVSDHIPEIVSLIQTLVEKGVAYVAKTPKGTDVYFAVRRFPDYGKLSHRNIDDLLAGARVAVTEDVKQDPLDFALWKGNDDGWGWPSPWGNGRPGWHIECSAMSAKYLGAHFDIHGGGMDLIFPHHENEIAQSEGAWGKEFARYWMHNGFVTCDSEKMSKSLGNFVTMGDVLARNDPEAFRYFLLNSHYRGPLAFDVVTRPDGRVVFPLVDEAERRVEYLYTTLDTLRGAADGATPDAKDEPSLKANAATVAEAEEKVLSALDKDLNTPAAVAALGELGKAANEIVVFTQKSKKDPGKVASGKKLARAAEEALLKAVKPLGLLESAPRVFFERTRLQRLKNRDLDAAAIDDKVRQRSEARAAKDFARGDALRQELAALGVEVLDGTDGTAWKVLI
jgi:cysteinyl-tRNA synthetase